MWGLFYRTGADSAAQSGALAVIARTGLSPIAREAVAQL